MGPVRRAPSSSRRCREAAWRTSDRDKRKALSRVLAEGIEDEARIEVSNLLAQAFRDIEAPHFRLLEHMARRPTDDTRAGGPQELAEASGAG